MKLKFKSILFLLFSFVMVAQAGAQVIDEWAARPNVSLKYKFNKSLSIAGTYYLYIDDNITKYDKSVIGFEVGYKINSWLKAGIDYRFGIEPQDHYHDIRYSVTLDHDLSKRINLAFRPMLQQEFASLEKEHLELHPVEYYLRNRLTLNYEISENFDLYIFTENYLETGKNNLSFYRQKSAIGADYKINERNKIGARMEIINKNSGKNVARPNISYSYTLGYVKKN